MRARLHRAAALACVATRKRDAMTIGFACTSAIVKAFAPRDAEDVPTKLARGVHRRGARCPLGGVHEVRAVREGIRELCDLTAIVTARVDPCLIRGGCTSVTAATSANRHSEKVRGAARSRSGRCTRGNRCHRGRSRRRDGDRGGRLDWCGSRRDSRQARRRVESVPSRVQSLRTERRPPRFQAARSPVRSLRRCSSRRRRRFGSGSGCGGGGHGAGCSVRRRSAAAAPDPRWSQP